MPKLPPIVGIVASAGGLEALQEFVQALPNDSGLACVVVQHLSPDQPSLMDKLLRAHTPVQVTQIEDGGTIEPDHVFIIPPGRFLTIEAGRFRLEDRDREEGVRTPIDRFFRSLADTAGRRAFAAVLSGTGSDGTMGVRAIKMRGGIALVQESRRTCPRGSWTSLITGATWKSASAAIICSNRTRRSSAMCSAGWKKRPAIPFPATSPAP
ncbi:chemotaxis protein CheB [Marinibacterium profundimaris]|uniref:chemotaxis protein CheB n=1 Tax=Marinibacterium profundimaris TaxID=1679460 RepID=UPI001302EBC5|nr:chemotaxis protein CheB [Marinibacterium profundimaris]